MLSREIWVNAVGFNLIVTVSTEYCSCNLDINKAPEAEPVMNQNESFLHDVMRKAANDAFYR